MEKMSDRLEIKNVSIGYAEKNVIKNLNTFFELGDVIAIVGANGSGKSSLLNTISGLNKPEYGDIKYNGFSIYSCREKYNAYLGYAPDRAPIFYEQSVIKYLKFVAKLRGLSSPNTRIKNVLVKFNLWEVRDEKISRLSKGTKQRINLAQSILCYPKILLLDEPSSGLDTHESERLYNHINKHSRHMIVVIATHDANEVNYLCNKALLLGEKNQDLVNVNDVVRRMNHFSEAKLVSLGVKNDTEHRKA